MSRRENWIKWDLCSREDPKTKWYLAQFQNKASAYGFFVWVVELLYQTNEGWIDLDLIFLEGVSHELGISVDEAKRSITKLIEAKLFLLEANRFASIRVLKVVENQKNLSSKRSEAGKKGGLNSGFTRSGEAKRSKPKQNEANEADQIRSDQINNTSLYRIDLPCLKFTDQEFKGFVVNYFHGQEEKCLDQIQAANDHLKANGKPVPADCSAYLKGWIRKSKQFECSLPNKNYRFTGQKKSNHEKNMELVAQLKAEEEAKNAQ
jgi:hypothetical protein